MEKSQCDSDSGGGGADMGLSDCVQCLQERTNGGPIPPLQTGLDLVL